MSMFDNEPYMQERMQYHPNDKEVSPAVYNLTIGGVLLYGFIVDALIVALFSGTALELLLSGMNYRLGLIIGGVLYFVCCFAGAAMVHRSDNPVISFIGFNLFAIPIGFLLAFAVVPFYSTGTLATAFVLTAIITAVMMIVASILPDTFLSMGRTLGIALLIAIVVDVVALLFGAHLVLIDYAVVFIFTLFIGYDWAKANRCVKTIDNAVDCAAELYLDMINVFIRILSILERD